MRLEKLRANGPGCCARRLRPLQGGMPLSSSSWPLNSCCCCRLGRLTDIYGNLRTFTPYGANCKLIDLNFIILLKYSNTWMQFLTKFWSCLLFFYSRAACVSVGRLAVYRFQLINNLSWAATWRKCLCQFTINQIIDGDDESK